MITFRNLPIPMLAPSVAEDPLAMRQQREAEANNPPEVAEESEEKIELRKQLAKAEAEAAAMHVAEQRARIEAINAEITSDADTVPVLGDMVAMTKPDMQPAKGVPRLDEPDAFEIRGYLDAEGNPTEAGEMFMELMDSGIFDEYGELTQKGKAYVMPSDESLQPENLAAFKIRDKAGLEDSEEITFGGAVSGVAGYLGDALKGAWATYMASAVGADDIAALGRNAAVMGAFRTQAQLGAGVTRVAEKMTLDSVEDEDAYYLSKQEYKRGMQELADMSQAELVGGLLGSEAVLSEMEAERARRVAEIGPTAAATLERQAEAFGSLVLDPSNAASFGAGFFVNKTANASTLFARLSTQVEKAAALKTQAAAAQTALIATESTFKKTSRMAELAGRQAERLASIGDNAAADAMRLREAGHAARSFTARQAADALAKETATLTDEAGKYALKAGDQAVLRTMQAVQEAKAIPLNAVAKLTESVGNKIIALDDGLSAIVARIGFDTPEAQKALKYMTVGASSVAAVSNPAFAAIPAVLAAGPVLKKISDFSRIVGKELIEQRGTLPFWRRVSQNAAASPTTSAVAHLIDEMTLGGKMLAPVRGAGTVLKGTAAAAPMDLGFEILAAGGETDSNVIKQALAESLVFGGTGAMAGSVVRGSLRQKQLQMAGDEINFRNKITDEAQKARFMSLGQGARRTIGTFAAMNPSLNIVLTDKGSSNYSKETVTATINVNQQDWLTPLVAHEVNHYIINRAQMETGIAALLVGPEGVGGLLRSKDGTLDPTFKAAMDAYNDRMRASGQQALTPEDFAVEYFNEATVDELVGMVDSGEMQRMARRTDTERVFREMASSLVQKTPIVRDLYVKLGGAFDKGGNMVQGNGLLAGGVRELPGAKKLLRTMVAKQAGRKNLELDPTSKVTGASKEKGVVIPKEMVKDGPMADTLFSLFEVDDATGKVKRDKDGDPIPIDRATAIKREMAGKIIIDLQKERIRRGQQLPEGSLEAQENGDWAGTFLDDEQVKALAESGIFNAEQVRTLNLLNQSARKRDGSTYAMVYQPALVRGKNGKVRYDGIAPTFREVVPVSIVITSKGNIIVQTMSVTQLMENIRERAGTKLGKRLYKGDQIEMLRDVEESLKLHRQGRKTDSYFEEKYGEANGKEYKNFVNTLFGEMTPGQRDINPLFAVENVTKRSNVFKSRRLDRINHTARLVGRPALYFGYELVKKNHFPIGVPGESPKVRIHEGTGLPLNKNGTVTLYHGTTKAAAAEIVRTKTLKSAGEFRIYLTTDPKAGAMDGSPGYGDGTVVAVEVDPDSLELDDEFPDGRMDFAIDAPRKLIKVANASSISSQ
jgi:hypothetical protein